MITAGRIANTTYPESAQLQNIKAAGESFNSKEKVRKSKKTRNNGRPTANVENKF